MREPTNTDLILDNLTPRPNEAINSRKESARLERTVDDLRHGTQEVQTFAVINQSLPAAKVSSESLICKSFLPREHFSSGVNHSRKKCYARFNGISERAISFS
ncbi:hypothetical protein TNIN_155781 [Trichonephila inaurata madagascariensis]|uniref:Uncharacterized protein n=1 Tax=Trichonephila inaurata madagascariensis TaxID=2747483 RepID=A0A8X6IUP7_9ARAC|nr:hypothetical protein TNIN_155781 [Trichonephila inaurata madagascariensis]